MLYKEYNYLFNQGKITTGFSQRLTDYAQNYKFMLLEKAINQTNKNCFLDIGAGSGRLTILMAKTYFKKGYALEINPNNKEWANLLKEHSKIQLKKGLLQKIIPEFIEKKERFDFILMSGVFEHIPIEDLDSFLKSLAKISEKNTKFYITTPNKIVQGLAEKSPRWYKIQEFGHHKHYTLAELESLFANYNFKIDWHFFESGYFKRNLYNKIFYKISRIDQKFITTKKLPLIIKKAYKIISTPFIIILKLLFWNLAKFIYFTEKHFNNEQNSETIVLLLSKK